MNGWLLLAACNLDDIPVQFYTKKPRVQDIKRRKPPRHNPLGTGRDISGFVCWKLLQFTAGKPATDCEFIYQGDTPPPEPEGGDQPKNEEGV
jgi:hypothetical protein